MQQEQISLGLSEDQTFSAPIFKENLPPSYQPTPNDPPWTTLNAFGVWVVSIVLLIASSGVGLVVYYSSLETKPESVRLLLDNNPQAILSMLVAVIPAHLLTLLLCWFVATQRGKYSLSETLGFKWGGFHLGYCILTVIGFYVLFGLLGYIFGPEDNELMKILRSSRTAVYVMAFLAVFTAPIVEEVVHRGILYSALQRSVGVPLAIFITSFIFAAIHFDQYKSSAVALIMISILSLGLTLIRWKSGNLLPCIATHMAFNGVQAVLILFEPYLEQPQSVPDPVNALIKMFL
jgi:membrane protease YdiL (CAAX protease family)